MLLFVCYMKKKSVNLKLRHENGNCPVGEEVGHELDFQKLGKASQRPLGETVWAKACWGCKGRGSKTSLEQDFLPCSPWQSAVKLVIFAYTWSQWGYLQLNPDGHHTLTHLKPIPNTCGALRIWAALLNHEYALKCRSGVGSWSLHF